MKSHISFLMATAAAFLTVLSCKPDNAAEDASSFEVSGLLMPSNGLKVNVPKINGLTFMWQAAEWKGEGDSSFELVFDREGGDFSDPLHRVVTDKSRIELSKEDVMTIYQALSDEGEEVTVIWAVYACSEDDRVLSAVRSMKFFSVQGNVPEDDVRQTYTNPLFFDFSLPDPDVIRGDDGYFYSYTTEHADHAQCRNVPIMRSADLLNWTKVGTMFTDATHPQITTNPTARIWAPAVHKVGNKYVCYYSQPGKNYKHAIGVATADNPWGPFTDHGKLIDSDEQGVDISIDAYLYQEDGRNYLFWGSFRKISVLELTADGLAIKDKATQKRVEVAGGQYEAAVVHKRGGYYYLLVSTGNYSKGGTYKIVVGRSTDIMGPYVDSQGRDMMKVKHEIVLEGNSDFSSPGHCSKIITDDNGQDWILYHAYIEEKNYRLLMLDRIDWTEGGWPVAPGRQASSEGEKLPYFK